MIHVVNFGTNIFIYNFMFMADFHVNFIFLNSSSLTIDKLTAEASMNESGPEQDAKRFRWEKQDR